MSECSNEIVTTDVLAACQYTNIESLAAFVAGLIETAPYSTHLDISFCIVEDTLNVRKLIHSLQRSVPYLYCLTSLNISGNFIFNIAPHPLNSNEIESLIEFTDILISSSITTIDMSNTKIIGTTGREHKGFLYLCQHYVAPYCVSFTCKYNSLHSVSLSCIANSLLADSHLTHLDISNNNIAKDNSGIFCSSGIINLASALQCNLSLTHINISSNHLQDEDIALICIAASKMTQLRYLSLSHNQCGAEGALCLGRLLVNHSSLDSPLGLSFLDISHNPIGAAIIYLAEGISRSETLISLNLNNCCLQDEHMEPIFSSLIANTNIQLLSLENNLVDIYTTPINSEISVNKMLCILREDARLIDVRDLTEQEYESLLRKIKTLPDTTLTALHDNPSFNEMETRMQLELHRLHPPSRSMRIRRLKETRILK